MSTLFPIACNALESYSLLNPLSIAKRATMILGTFAACSTCSNGAVNAGKELQSLLEKWAAAPLADKEGKLILPPMFPKHTHTPAEYVEIRCIYEG